MQKDINWNRKKSRWTNDKKHLQSSITTVSTANWFIDYVFASSINLVCYSQIDWLIDCLIYGLIDWLAEWLIDWLIDWLNGWLIDWVVFWELTHYRGEDDHITAEIDEISLGLHVEEQAVLPTQHKPEKMNKLDDASKDEATDSGDSNFKLNQNEKFQKKISRKYQIFVHRLTRCTLIFFSSFFSMGRTNKCQYKEREVG